MSDEPAIRLLSPDDWRVLREVRLAALASDPGAFGSTLADHAAATEADWREWTGHRSVVAELAGRPVGLARLSEETDGTAELVSMWVSPEVRGRDVAKRLVRAIARLARGYGHRELRLWVVDDNEAAIRLYERCGFEATGLRQPVVPDDERDHRVEVQMSAPLEWTDESAG